MFSKACEYAIRSALLVASHSLKGERVSIRDIAAESDSPMAFTAKIMQQLAKGGILYSVQGKHGGFEMSKEQMQTTRLSRIVSLIDGDKVFTGCGLGLKACNALKPCPLHNQFVVVRNELQQMLENTTILDLTLDLNNGQTFLKR